MRIAIMGSSFGAYLALSGVAHEPELYRCAVTIAGVVGPPAIGAASTGRVTPRSSSSGLISVASGRGLGSLDAEQAHTVLPKLVELAWVVEELREEHSKDRPDH